MKKHVLLSLLAVAALTGLFLQRRCSATAATPRQLWSGRDAWTGQNVEVTGELKEFAGGTADAHYAVEDEGFRVGVRGGAASAWVGRRVRARGVFVFTEKTGGYLESPSLTAQP